MPTGNLKLTSLDKKILHSYCQTLDGLSNYLGNGYEIVLHSLEDYEHSAIKVINSCQGREGQNYRTALYQLLYEYNDGRFLPQLCCSDSI